MKKVFAILTIFLYCFIINAQQSKNFAINIAQDIQGITSFGLYFTQPLGEKTALSLSAMYGGDIYTSMFPIKLDFSYRILEKPLNVYIGGGIEADYGEAFITPLGVSYGWKSFVGFVEYSTSTIRSSDHDDYYYDDYYYGDYYSSYIETYSSLIFGIRWYYK